jgi:regulator of replication initiation timing
MKADSDLSEVDQWKEMVESVQQANDRMNGWIEDGVISPMEKQSLKDELANIIAEKKEIDKQSKRYELTETEEYKSYTKAYNSYTDELNRILDSEEENVKVGDSLSVIQTAYYEAYVTINDKISEANHTFINTLETG